ncbi:MAG TPA: hypothetical protein VF060_05125 [Trebonia sp.]
MVTVPRATLSAIAAAPGAAQVPNDAARTPQLISCRAVNQVQKAASAIMSA